jgi:hypothetical protein
MKILFPSPYNTQVIMWDRGKILKFSCFMCFQIAKIKFDFLIIFLVHPLFINLHQEEHFF